MGVHPLHGQGPQPSLSVYLFPAARGTTTVSGAAECLNIPEMFKVHRQYRNVAAGPIIHAAGRRPMFEV